MILIIGLGNPGKKYQKTRHNLGFRVVNEFVRRNNFPKLKFSKKLNAQISEGVINSKKIILANPQTFMNLSGKSVKPLAKSYCVNKAMAELTQHLWVVHDDIDLPLGKIRISIGRGAAGHKGVESIIKELQTKNFVRFRIGIQPKTGKPKNIEKFVLQKPSKAKLNEAGDETKSQRPFNKEEEKILKEVIEKTVEVIKVALIEGVEKAMSRYNK